MTTSRTSAAQGVSLPVPKDTSWPNEVRKFLFQLQTEALSALPVVHRGDVALAGTRIPQDVKWLNLYLNKLFPTLDALETNFLPEMRDTARHNHAFQLLYILLDGAHFIGSRARMSLSQKNYFAAKQALQAGRRSGLGRTRKAETWRIVALKRAKELRMKDPFITQDALANEVQDCLRGPTPKHDTLRRYLASMEKANRLARRARKKR